MLACDLSLQLDSVGKVDRVTASGHEVFVNSIYASSFHVECGRPTKRVLCPKQKSL